MKKSIVIFLLLSVSVLLFAVPASPEPFIVKYDDGSALTVLLKGDENFHWYETVDGFQIKKNVNNRFEYVQKGLYKTNSFASLIAHDPDIRDAQERDLVSQLSKEIIVPQDLTRKMGMGAPMDSPFDQTDFPTLGSRKFLLILVDFPDLPMTHRADDFDSLMNGKNYTYNQAIGSVNKYYRTTSFEQFDPTFDVAGPFTLDSSYTFYGADEGDYSDVNIQTFVYDAIMAANPTVDFSDYDLDSDGYVDNVYFIYAGYGQASGAPDNTIWPHRWAYISGNLVVDGKRIFDYSTSNELYGTSGTTRTSIGVICHEFGHVCGLPDFYDTDYSGSGGNCGGLGDWDEMAGGSWNYSGRRPPIFNAWSRMYLRWSTPVELSGVESVTLDPAHTSNESRYFMSATNDEFFMMENRQQVGFDAGIPGHGLLIFHIDMNSSRWNDNTLNCNPDRQAFDLEEADGYGNPNYNYIDAGDAFPGTSGNTSFLDTGSPNALDWSGNLSRSPIRSIQEIGGIVSFNFGDENVDKPGNVVFETVGQDSVTISWTLNDDADSVILLWSTDGPVGYPESLHAYDIGDMVSGAEVIYKGIDTVFYHMGLRPGTTQYYALYSFNDSAYVYSDRVSGSAKTTSPPFYRTDFSEGIPQGWVIFDRYNTGSFSMDNPEGRTINSNTANNGFIVMDSEHAGNVMIDAEMITQSYNFALSRSVTLSFEHRLEVGSITLARILYTVNNGLTWFEAARWTQTTPDPLKTVLDLSADVSGFSNVKFKFNYKAANEKYWCIDDFMIAAAQDTGLSAGFYTADISGSKPLTVHFMNTSVSGPDSIDSYIWEFGDGGDFFYEKDPVHTYTSSGTFTVSMAATKNGKISNCVKDNYIQVINDAPIVINDEDTLDVAKNVANTYNLNRFFMDPNGDPLTYTWIGNSANLTISLQDDSLIVLTPGADYLGTETVTIIAKDNENDSTSHTVDVWVSETAISDIVPGEFRVSQNYPNPFNPSTSINFQLPVNQYVTLNVYDLNGHKVKALINGIQDAGYYTVQFHAGDLPSGVYLYRLTAGNEVVTKKMVLMK